MFDKISCFITDTLIEGKVIKIEEKKSVPVLFQYDNRNVRKFTINNNYRSFAAQIYRDIDIYACFYSA